MVMYIMLNRKQRIAEQKMQNDMKKEKKSKGKVKASGDGDGATKSTLEKMLDKSSKPADAANSTAVPDDAAGLDDDMLSVVKRRRELAAKAAEEKKIKDAEKKLL